MRLTAERLFWHCGAHTAKPESAPGSRSLVTKVCCFLWHVEWHAKCSLGQRQQRHRIVTGCKAKGGWEWRYKVSC